MTHALSLVREPSKALEPTISSTAHSRRGDAVEEYDDDLAVARLAWVAHNDQAALDQACEVSSPAPLWPAVGWNRTAPTLGGR